MVKKNIPINPPSLDEIRVAQDRLKGTIVRTPLLRKLVDDVVIVPEEKVKVAIKQLVLENRLVIEGSGALSIAAALEMSVEKQEKTICIVTGGNIGTEALSEILSET